MVRDHPSTIKGNEGDHGDRLKVAKQYPVQLYALPDPSEPASVRGGMRGGVGACGASCAELVRTERVRGALLLMSLGRASCPARKVGASSALGKQLDSLADAISFGAVSGFIWSSILADYARMSQPWAMLIGAMVTASSIYRLGVFNLKEDGEKDFTGMPTPANALFALGLWSWMGQWENWEWIMSFNGTTLLLWHFGLVALALYTVFW